MKTIIDSPESTINQLPKANKDILFSRNVTNLFVILIDYFLWLFRNLKLYSYHA